MRGTSIALAGALWASVFANSLSAQPILNRVEQFVREQIGNIRNNVNGPLRPAEPGFLGLTADDREDEGRAVRVVSLVPAGPAVTAGLQVGDQLTAIGGQTINTMDDVARALQGQPEGTRLIVKVMRGDDDRQFDVTLGRRPPKPAGPVSEELPHPTPIFENEPVAPVFGVRTVNVSEDVRQKNNLSDSKGAVVVSVTEGSPADRGGIPNGAVIVAFDGKPIDAPPDLSAAVRAAGAREVNVQYIHEGHAGGKRVSLAPAAPVDAAKVETRGRPVANPPDELPAAAPTPSDDPKTALLEARIRELEQRIKKLEAAIAGSVK